MSKGGGRGRIRKKLGSRLGSVTDKLAVRVGVEVDRVWVLIQKNVTTGDN